MKNKENGISYKEKNTEIALLASLKITAVDRKLKCVAICYDRQSKHLKIFSTRFKNLKKV